MCFLYNILHHMTCIIIKIFIVTVNPHNMHPVTIQKYVLCHLFLVHHKKPRQINRSYTEFKCRLFKILDTCHL